MKIAIVGGGLAGVCAAYELARLAKAGAQLDVTLYEAGPRLGGLLETHREDGFVIECGADSWVTEKPWAREFAIELGLEGELIGSNDTWRRTYLLRDRRLEAMPDGMRMMVPVAWAPLLASPLFSTEAKLAYLREPRRAEELKVAAFGLEQDESVRDFVARHFGEEIADNIAAPLLSGVFGGDIRNLSAQAVMPVFVRLAKEQGSLVLGLQQRAHAAKVQAATFTSLRNGLQTLPEKMTAAIPTEWVRLNTPVTSLHRNGESWRVFSGESYADFDAVIVAAPAKVAGRLLMPIDARFTALQEMKASSAIIVALAFDAEQSRSMRIPRGFGFLVPQTSHTEIKLMAATFVDQKFSHRVPAGGTLLRGFFGGASATELLEQSDEQLIELARRELGSILGVLPPTRITLVRRWEDSLPQYAVGHLDRVAEMERAVGAQPNLRLAGNALYGVGIPDVIRQGRSAARSLIVI